MTNRSAVFKIFLIISLGYQCPYCPKTFKTSVQLSGHKNSHTKPFSCTECSRPFATLVTFINFDENGSVNIYMKFNFSFLLKYAVKIHMQSHQKVNHSLKHACDICGATYARGKEKKNFHTKFTPISFEIIKFCLFFDKDLH